MKLTNHEEYGLRCLLRLAEQGSGASLTIPELSGTEGVSEAYAAKLLRILRQAGFIKATRGKAGGYTLARPADEIVVADVLAALGGPLFQDDFCSSHAGDRSVCARSPDCSLRSLWRTVQDAVDLVLSRTTLASLIHGERSSAPWTPLPAGFGIPAGQAGNGGTAPFWREHAARNR